MPMRVTQMPDLDAVARAAIDGAVLGMREGLEIIRAEAAMIVHAERYATGHLQQSLHAEVLPPQGSSLEGTVGSSAPYAPFVEYDTRPHVAPFAPFLPWATVKGFRGTGRSFVAGSAPQARLARIGWLGVKLHGTKGIHFLERALDSKGGPARDRIFARIREAVSRFASS